MVRSFKIVMESMFKLVSIGIPYFNNKMAAQIVLKHSLLEKTK